jgi:hypothetical protein
MYCLAFQSFPFGVIKIYHTSFCGFDHFSLKCFVAIYVKASHLMIIKIQNDLIFRLWIFWWNFIFFIIFMKHCANHRQACSMKFNYQRFEYWSDPRQLGFISDILISPSIKSSSLFWSFIFLLDELLYRGYLVFHS